MVRQALLAAAAFLACAAPAAYSQEVKLQLKFKEGEKFWVEDVATQKQSITANGQVIKIDSKNTTITSYTVKKVTPDSVVMVMKVEDVKSEGGLGGAGDIVAKTKGATLTVTMMPSGKVKKIEGFDEFLKQMTGEDEVAKLMKEFITEDMFAQNLDQSFGFVPEKAVKPDDTWVRDAKFSLGPFGDFKLNAVYKYAGKKDGAEDIKLKHNLQYVPPKAGPAALGGLFKVLRGDLKGDGKGAIIFNNEKGRVVSATTTMKAQGTLTIEVSGMEGQLEMSMDTSTTSRVLDTNPLKNRP